MDQIVQAFRDLVADGEGHAQIDELNANDRKAINKLVDEEGYRIFYFRLTQKGTGQQYTMKTLNAPGSTFVETLSHFEAKEAA